MTLPLVSPPTRDGPFALTLSDDSVYYLPAALLPSTFRPGRPADTVGRAVGSTTWIRFGPGGREPGPLRFRGRLFGSDASAQLNELRIKVRDAVSVTYRGLTITLEDGDVNGREVSLRVFDVTVILLPDGPGRLY
jgi:hypothetical protein